MLPSYSSPLVLRTLRSPLCRALPVARFSTAALRAEEFTADTPPQPQPRPQTPLPYFILRSRTNNLPVYEESKQGGSLRQTRIRKIEGDLLALRRDVIRTLGIDVKGVKIVGVAKHIIIKGWVKKDVTKMLGDLGF